MEAHIERTFVKMLGSSQSPGRGGSGKGIVLCGEVEERVFGSVGDATDSKGPSGAELIGGDASSEDEGSDGGVTIDDVETVGPRGAFDNDLTPQQLGRQRAANREKVRQAARRGVVFGFLVDETGYDNGGERKTGGDFGEKGQKRRRVEAVQGGRVVEASFAKGEWGVKWRDDNI